MIKLLKDYLRYSAVHPYLCVSMRTYPYLCLAMRFHHTHTHKHTHKTKKKEPPQQCRRLLESQAGLLDRIFIFRL